MRVALRELLVVDQLERVDRIGGQAEDRCVVAQLERAATTGSLEVARASTPSAGSSEAGVPNWFQRTSIAPRPAAAARRAAVGPCCPARRGR
ncbi:hypothetical protein [Nocardioides pyridinolyticus]